MTLPVDPHKYLTFLGVMALLAMTPGPANLFAVATGVRDGKAAALMGVVGMNAASLVWFCGAALGLGAVVAAFPDRRGRGRSLRRLARDPGHPRRRQGPR